jgi:hypothetical protein
MEFSINMNTGKSLSLEEAVEAIDKQTALINTLKDALAKYVSESHEQDVGGGDLVVATCESLEQANKALSAVEQWEKGEDK